jgi:hypothetical protein
MNISVNTGTVGCSRFGPPYALSLAGSTGCTMFRAEGSRGNSTEPRTENAPAKNRSGPTRSAATALHCTALGCGPDMTSLQGPLLECRSVALVLEAQRSAVLVPLLLQQADCVPRRAAYRPGRSRALGTELQISREEERQLSHYSD